MSIGSMPFHYLGILLEAKRLKISSYDSIVNKITAYIGAWTRASLSYVGETKFVRIVLEGVECFWLSILPIPPGCIKCY